MHFLTHRDVYNIICGDKYFFYSISCFLDVRSSNLFSQSHIVGAKNFDVKLNYLLPPNELLNKITISLKVYNISNVFKVVIADNNSIVYFQQIQQAFKSQRVRDIYFMEGSYEEFKNQYPFVCSDNCINVSSLDFAYPSEILPNLLLGCCPPTRYGEKYFGNLKITHVLNLTNMTYEIPKDIVYLALNFEDDSTAEIPFVQIVQFIDKALSDLPVSAAFTASSSSCSSSSSSSAFLSSSLSPSSSADQHRFSSTLPLSFSSPRCLVHCAAGVSRSASGVMAYLLFKYRWTVRQCAQLVKTQRSVVEPNAGFVRQLFAYAKKLEIQDDDEKVEKEKEKEKEGESQKKEGNVPFDIRAYTKLPLAHVDFLDEAC